MHSIVTMITYYIRTCRENEVGCCEEEEDDCSQDVVVIIVGVNKNVVLELPLAPSCPPTEGYVGV